MPRMTPDKEAEFFRLHPIGTMLLFGVKPPGEGRLETAPENPTCPDTPKELT